jgi:4'-phosphopantetheinyl transferase
MPGGPGALMNLAVLAPGLDVLRVETTQLGRPAARCAIRTALRELVSERLGLASAQVVIHSRAGSAPQLLLDGHASRCGISISHAGAFAVAAFHRHGPVGIDAMQLQDLPDLARVALDYLGPHISAALAACVPAQRTAAFAQAWAAREAQLKCLGLPLAEYTPLPACVFHPLDLPQGFAGVVATLADQAAPAG